MPSDPEGLLASSKIVEEQEIATGAAIAVGSFSRQPAGGIPSRWEPFVILPSLPRTLYRLVASDEGTVLEASADKSASGLYRRIRIDPKSNPVVEWRWKIVQPVQGADVRVPSRDDSPARLVVSFHGDINRLDFSERVTLRWYKALTGQTLPYAMLMYVSAASLRAGTTVPNEHTEKIQTIVVSGDEGRGQWIRFRRNVLEDYRHIFGEDPGEIVAVGVMTDSDDTRQQARTLYGDITFLEGQ
jgi:hypothetical protein